MGASHLSGQNLLKSNGITNLDVDGQLRRTSIFFPRSRVSNGSSLEAYLLPFSTRASKEPSNTGAVEGLSANQQQPGHPPLHQEIRSQLSPQDRKSTRLNSSH